MDFNVNLAACIEEAEHATEKATRELVKVTRRYDLTPDGIEGERQRLYAVATQTAEAAKAHGVELIDAKIAELDAAEVKAAERRAAALRGSSLAGRGRGSVPVRRKQRDSGPRLDGNRPGPDR